HARLLERGGGEGDAAAGDASRSVSERGGEHVAAADPGRAERAEQIALKAPPLEQDPRVGRPPFLVRSDEALEAGIEEVARSADVEPPREGAGAGVAAGFEDDVEGRRREQLVRRFDAEHLVALVEVVSEAAQPRRALQPRLD